MPNGLNIVIGGRGYGKTYALIKRYIKVAELFNIRNKDKYSIYVTIDLCYFHIRLLDRETNKWYRVSVLNNLIHDATSGEILRIFEELRDSIDKETNTIVLKIEGVSDDNE